MPTALGVNPTDPQWIAPATGTSRSRDWPIGMTNSNICVSKVRKVEHETQQTPASGDTNSRLSSKLLEFSQL